MSLPKNQEQTGDSKTNINAEERNSKFKKAFNEFEKFDRRMWYLKRIEKSFK
jgi:hypothetical protein